MLEDQCLKIILYDSYIEGGYSPQVQWSISGQLELETTAVLVRSNTWTVGKYFIQSATATSFPKKRPMLSSNENSPKPLESRITNEKRGVWPMLYTL